MFGIITGLSFPLSYLLGRKGLTIRNRVYFMRYGTHMAFMTSIYLMWQTSYLRLTGFWDNGLRWSTPNYELKKFDMTSLYESN